MSLTDSKDTIVELLRDCGRDRLADRVNNCGSFISAYYCSAHTDHYGYIVHRCGWRYCPTCSSIKAARLVKKYLNPVISHLKSHPRKNYRLMLLTLTSPKPHNDLSCRRLLSDASILLKHFYGTDGQGSIISLDIGKSGNIHAHAIVYGAYHSQALLSAFWHDLHGAPIVDIREIKSTDHIITHFFKYLFKSITDSTTQGDAVPLEDPHPDALGGLLCFFAGHYRLQSYRVYGIFRSLSANTQKLPLLCPICGSPLIFESRNPFSIVDSDWFDILSSSYPDSVVYGPPSKIISYRPDRCYTATQFIGV